MAENLPLVSSRLEQTAMFFKHTARMRGLIWTIAARIYRKTPLPLVRF